jgi:membrane protein YqaA with SNARE-associated domain
MKAFVIKLQKFIDQWWYNYLLGILACIDHLILIIPTDGLLVSSAMLNPKKWKHLAICVTVGSTMGAVLLAEIAKIYGLPYLNEHFTSVVGSPYWAKTQIYFESYGLGFVFLLALSPLAQQPGVILAGLAGVSIPELTIVVFLGRILKYSFLAYLSVFAPNLIYRLWGIQGEIKEVGVDKH